MQDKGFVFSDIPFTQTEKTYCQVGDECKWHTGPHSTHIHDEKDKDDDEEGDEDGEGKGNSIAKRLRGPQGGNQHRPSKKQNFATMITPRGNAAKKRKKMVCTTIRQIPCFKS